MSEEAKQETPKTEAPKEAPKKKDNTLKIVLIVVGIIVGAIVIFWIGIAIFVGSIFHRATDGVKVNSDGKNGSVTIKSNDGQSTGSYGTNVRLPEGFPSDVPVYKPSTTVAASKTGDKAFSASAKTNATVETVLNYYRDELAKQGWTTVHESSYSEGTILSVKKANRTLTVSISNQKNEPTEKTFISLSTNTLD